MMRKLLRNESGVALLMVMTAILVLMALWGDFTFESKISRIKTTNLLDKTQSRMMAETALELAMVRLRIYKEAYNLRVNNQNAQGAVSPQLLNQLWEIPFVYPIPQGKNMGAQAKSAINDFQKDTFLEGEMKLSIQNISNKINLNMMRLTQLKAVTTPPNTIPNGNQPPPPPPPAPPQLDHMFSMEQQLVNHMQRRLREKGDQDENFRDSYGSIDVLQLVANLKYYISDRNPRRINTTQVEMLMDNSEQLFNEAKIAPKHGPMTSMSELSLIPGWDDALVALLGEEFDVFPAVMIDLNKLTTNMLRLLIPSMNEDEAKEFFQWRDNPDRPQFINTLADFKRYIVNQANIISESTFDDRFQKFAAQGIQFGASPTLFRVNAEGTSNRVTTTLVATVALPTTPSANNTPATTGNTAGGANTTTGATAGGATGGTTATTTGNTGGGTAGNQTAQALLDPRVIDIQLN